MANGYQKHILVGNLGADPLLNTTRNGNLVTNFDIAVNERNVDGTVTVTWYGITAWNGLGEACAQYLKKGRQVMVEGSRMEVNAWMGRDGNLHTKMELTAKDVRFLGDANGNGQQQAPLRQQVPQRQQHAPRQQAPRQQQVARQQAPQQQQSPRQQAPQQQAPQQAQAPRRQSAPAPRQRRQGQQQQQPQQQQPQQQVPHGYIPDNPEDVPF